ncbi:ABC transporter substrate-binding protein [Paenibacillus sp. sptzw28]|uniref:ABC transporter substrate-binding protein n=1 Tax=Paenibacillus sp. sptzw28 TaxID=715179 RepID=UPI001C6E85CA|nr:ABC transporter substrate-binding protein [Paenibacillus sp. sptzw28]QYR19468.1 ABC transporter substrate-binding protein [Paenibacillus sp. sptzw28]
MNIKKTLARFLVLAAVFAFLLSGCSFSNNTDHAAVEEDQQKQFSFSIVYAGGDVAHKQAVSTMIAAFERSHPNITITEINSGSGTYLEYLKTKDAVGEFPDLVEMRDTQMFADAGLIAELPEDLTMLFRSIPTVNGKVYNAPLELPAPQGIIYNKEIFRQAGISREPRTYREFLEDCAKIKRLGITPIVVGGKDIWHMGFWVNKFLMDNVYADNPDWNAQRTAGQVSWTDAGPMKAMKQLSELWKNGDVDPKFITIADNQTASYLAYGKAAMLYSGPWMFRQILEIDAGFELGFFALPDNEGNIVVNGLPSPAGWSISSDAAADPDKLKVIKQFLYFFFNEEQYPNYLSVVGGIPSTSAYISYKTTQPMRKVLAIMNDPKTKKSLMMSSFWGKNDLPPDFRNWFYKLVQDMLSGSYTVEEAMKMADREWDRQEAALPK